MLLTHSRSYRPVGCTDGYLSRPSAFRGTRLYDPPTDIASRTREASGSLFLLVWTILLLHIDLVANHNVFKQLKHSFIIISFYNIHFNM